MEFTSGKNLRQVKLLEKLPSKEMGNTPTHNNQENR
jgi:hypothetical protein